MFKEKFSSMLSTLATCIGLSAFVLSTFALGYLSRGQGMTFLYDLLVYVVFTYLIILLYELGHAFLVI